jgi:hypothetical protein
MEKVYRGIANDTRNVTKTAAAMGSTTLLLMNAWANYDLKKVKKYLTKGDLIMADLFQEWTELSARIHKQHEGLRYGGKHYREPLPSEDENDDQDEEEQFRENEYAEKHNNEGYEEEEYEEEQYAAEYDEEEEHEGEEYEEEEYEAEYAREEEYYRNQQDAEHRSPSVPQAAHIFRTFDDELAECDRTLEERAQSLLEDDFQAQDHQKELSDRRDLLRTYRKMKEQFQRGVEQHRADVATYISKQGCSHLHQQTKAKSRRGSAESDQATARKRPSVPPLSFL